MELLDLARAAAGIGTFDWDLITGRLSWDDRLLELFDLTPATFDQTIEGFNARVHPDDLGRVSELLDRAITTCGDYEAEYRVLCTDGSLRWIAARGRALCDEAGDAVRLLGAAWDVTDRRKTQDRIARALEGMAVGYLVMDADWRIGYVNARAEKALGLPRAELVGGIIWERFPGTVGTDFEAGYRRAKDTGQPVTFDAYYPEPLNAWYEVRATPEGDGVALYFLDITERYRTYQRNELLGQTTHQLTGTLNAEEAVARLAQLVVPTLADWCLVSLVSDEQHTNIRRALRDVGHWHTDPDERALVEAYARVRLAAATDEPFLARALSSGEPVVIERDASERIRAVLTAGEATELLEQLAPESAAVLPLRGRGRTVGLLTLFNGPARGPIPPNDLSTATDIAGRAGMALDNARLYREQRSLAEGLQRSLLTAPPQPDHGQIVVRYVPASQAAQVGGDWYDAFLQPGGATVLAIGDVIGHDTQAAAAMGQIRTIVRSIGALDDQSPATILRRADEVMERLMVRTAATIALARLEQTPDDLQRGITRLRWSNAGHPPPFVINPDGTVLPLTRVRADLLLGVRPDSARHEAEVVLDHDAVVLLYTDGLVERRDEDLDQGTQRLQDTLEELAGRDLDELCDELLARMLPHEPDDDVALIAIRLFRRDRPRPAQAGPNVVPPDVPPHRDVASHPD
ncbi:histidine kinase [Blastococcus sp. TF02-8]|uniref:SpoIIE family protein phosphatase n=1 Tax=Blastococcus sp. TF02-8 TaxID=2250574 RepID=UPI000DE8103E|nr:SpoIIE family protein phosphatase [Blastococcus sp. TF02-8]RBY91943.1 histidine kinase [Blastococcus sp. TF02-8]